MYIFREIEHDVYKLEPLMITMIRNLKQKSISLGLHMAVFWVLHSSLNALMIHLASVMLSAR